jgi:hypothetical protein
LQSQTNVPPAQIIETIEFSVSPVYLNREYLHQKYIVECLSAAEIGREIVSATSTVHKYLKLFKIPIGKSGANIRPKRHLAYVRISAKPVTCFGASRSPVSAQAGQRC